MSRTAFPWKMLAIAASAMVVFFVCGFVNPGCQAVQAQQPGKSAKGGMLAATLANEVAVPKKALLIHRASDSSRVKKARIHFKHKSSQKKVAATLPVTAVVDEGPTPLNEMLVMSINAPKPVEDADKAHPKKGWDNLEKYFSTEAVAPDGKGGTVKVSFVVNPDGALKDFKVQQSLDEIADKKAIELLKNGPTWQGNIEKQPAEVTVSIAFH